MLNSEIHEKLDVLLDKHELPWFEPEEKDIFLNFAMNEFIKKRYSEFELNEKRSEDLRTLILTQTGSGNIIPAPSLLMFIISLKGVFSVTKCGKMSNIETFIQPSQHDDINKMLKDPFNKPTNEFPLYTTTNTGIVIYSSSNAISFEMTYLKLPTAINGAQFPSGNIGMPEHTYEEIINIAVRKLLGSMESQAYNIQSNEVKSQE